MPNIIPMPRVCYEKDGWFTIGNNIEILSSEETKEHAEALLNYIRPCFTAFSGKVVITDDLKVRNTSDIVFIKESHINKESYKIDIDNDNFVIRAGAKAGFNYAVTTLLQLLNVFEIKNTDKITVDNIHIEDEPRFEWRSYMLDEARHFFGEQEVLRLLDIMALHKLNKFHWHLSDDQGFRIELDKFPKLTEVGSKRSDTQIGGWNSKRYKGAGHSGFYTKEQIKRIVKYAEDRNIEIIPEIDVPGHTLAMIAAYPMLSCNKENVAVSTKFGVMETILCAGDEKVYEFVCEMLDEICELFPGRYFHIGGDEVPKTSWEKCSVCQEKMRSLGISNYTELHINFMNRIASYLKTKSKTAIVWDDIVSDKLNENVIIQYYTTANRPNAITQIRKGRAFIISRSPSFYFDYPYAMISLGKVYSTNLLLEEFEELDVEWHNNILGAEACLWTEWVYDREKLDFNTLPRMTALAERTWSDETCVNYDNFLERLAAFEKILDKFNIGHAPKNIYNQSSKFRKWRDANLWRGSDQYSEVRRNRK